MLEKQRIVFQKYHCCGNTFIIVDESIHSLPDDTQRSAFAVWALNQHFGIGGSDNVLFLKALNPEEKNSDYCFRIFEHDGAETLFCGNGLLSSMDMLHRSTQRTHIGMLTRWPSGVPERVETGIDEAIHHHAWVNVGFPSPAPTNIYTGSDSDNIVLLNIPDNLKLSGHFVFNGEPHLVFLSEHGLPDKLKKEIWQYSATSITMIQAIGDFVNEAYQSLFPQGVHLNFSRINAGSIEYRTYERAINIETFACGSGGAAVAYVYWKNKMIEASSIRLKPYRCSQYDPDLSLDVAYTSEGIILSGHPECIYKGETIWHSK